MTVSPSAHKTQQYIIYTLFIGIIVLLFGQCVTFGFGLDDFLISENIPGRADGLMGLLRIFSQHYNQTDYRPIVILSFALEKWITGDIYPSFSHAINLVLYLFCLMVTYSTISKYWAKDSLYNNNVIVVGLLFFIVHPVHTEVIASLKNRDNLLSLLFAILTVKYSWASFAGQQHKTSKMVLSAVFFLLALFSKMDAAGLLIFLPLFLFAIAPKEDSKRIIYFFVLFVLIFFIIRLTLVDVLLPIHPEKITSKGTTFTENPLSQDFSLSNRIAAAALTFWYYIKLLLVPFGYRYYYGFNTVKLYSISSWQGISALTGIFFLAILIRKFAYHNKLLLAGLGGFGAFILYALNFITPMAGIIADRYIFISSLFFCGLLSYILSLLIKNRKYYLATSACLILALAASSYCRTAVWKDKLTLIDADAPHLYDSYEAMRIAASTYIESADLSTDTTEKKTLLEKAITCAASGNAVYPHNILMHKLQATAYFKNNQFDQAKHAFLQALQNDSSDVESYNFLGDIFYLNKQPDSALYYYKKSLYLDKEDATTINNISSILYESGDKKACLEFNEQLLVKQDSLYAAWENLGYYYLQEKDTLQAAANFERGFEHGLENTEMAETMSAYFNRLQQPQKAAFFCRFSSH